VFALWVECSLGGHAFSVTEVQELDMLIGVLDPAEALEYAPLLLGWSTFLCLASFLPSQNGQLPLQVHALFTQICE
jgi:hypothetical protein